MGRSQPDGVYSRVLNQGHLGAAGDTWKCLRTFWVVTRWDSLLLGEGRGRGQVLLSVLQGKRQLHNLQWSGPKRQSSSIGGVGGPDMRPGSSLRQERARPISCNRTLRTMTWAEARKHQALWAPRLLPALSPPMEKDSSSELLRNQQVKYGLAASQGPEPMSQATVTATALTVMLVSFLPLCEEATTARYWMTFLVFSVFPAPDSPLKDTGTVSRWSSPPRSTLWVPLRAPGHLPGRLAPGCATGTEPGRPSITRRSLNLLPRGCRREDSDGTSEREKLSFPTKVQT